MLFEDFSGPILTIDPVSIDTSIFADCNEIFCYPIFFINLYIYICINNITSLIAKESLNQLIIAADSNNNELYRFSLLILILCHVETLLK